MNKIEITVASRLLYILHYLGSLIIAAILTSYIFKIVNNISEIVFIAILGGIWYIITRFTKELPKGRVKLEITKDGIQVIWIKQILLHNRKDVLIKWEDISDYMYQPEQHFDLLRIRTKDNRRLKLSMIGDNSKFLIFYFNMEDEIKSRSSDGFINIKKAKNIYESTYGLIGAVFIGAVIIVGLFAFIFIEPKGNTKPNYGLLLGSLAGGIFFIINVIAHRKKNNKTN